MSFSRIIFAVAILLNVAGGAFTVSAQDFPRKLIRIVVGFPPGVPADVMARILAPSLSEGLGQQVIVENKPGAGSSIAGDHVAKSDPDGHTLFMSSIANSVAHSANKVSYHLADDLAAVSLIADVPGVLVAHPSMPATLNEFVAAAKAKPGAYAFGSSGTGSSSHLFGELLNLNAGIKLLHVPYRGSSQTLTDLIAGRIQAFFSPASTVLEQIKAGNVRALAVMGEKRTPLLSDIPTFAEQGYQGFEAAFWFGLNVPRATPQAVVQRLNKEIVRVMALPDVREKLLSHTIEPTSSSPAAFDVFVRRDIEKWRRVVSAAGIKPE